MDGDKNRPQVCNVFARASQLVRDLFEASARTENAAAIHCMLTCYSKPLKSSDKPSGLFISAFQSEWKVLLLALLVFLPFPRKKGRSYREGNPTIDEVCDQVLGARSL